MCDASLLPCPFCGGPAEIWRAHANRPAWIACMGRCVVLITKEHVSDPAAIAAWNTRVPVPPEGPGQDRPTPVDKQAEATRRWHEEHGWDEHG